MEKKFIKNILEVKLNSKDKKLIYVVKALYVNTIGGFTETVKKEIAKITLTWEEINAKGGTGKVSADIKEKYNVQSW